MRAGVRTQRAGQLLGLLACLLPWTGVQAQSAGRDTTARARRPSVPLATVVVTPGAVQAGDAAIASVPGVLSIARTALERQPQPLEDLFRTLGRLPGTVGADQSARVAVRGAAPAQTGVMLDGMTLVDPFHVKDFDGGLSVMPLELLDGITMLAGGLPVEYGDHLGGMVLLEPARVRALVPGRDRPDLSITAGLTGVRATAQHALDTTGTEWIVSGRRGWVNAVVHAAGGDGDVRPLFSDAYARVTRWLGPATRLTVHGLSVLDDFALKTGGAPTLRSRSTDETTWATVAHTTAHGRQMVTLGLDHRVVRRDAQGASRPFDKTSLHEDRVTQALSLRGLTEWEGGPAFALRAGADLWTGRTIASSGLFATGLPVTVPRFAGRGTHGAVWIAARRTLGSGITVDAGLRGDRWDWLSSTVVQPRAALTWTPARRGPTMRWSSGLQAEGMPFDGRALTEGDPQWGSPSRAWQHALSISQTLARGQMQLEVYQRHEQLNRPRWINASAGLTPAPELEPDRMRLWLRDGQLWGTELSARAAFGTVQWSAAWTHAVARDRTVDGSTSTWLPRPWDIRDALTVDAGLAVGQTWTLALGYSWHAGWPVSQATVLEPKGQLPRLVWPTVFSARTPEYHRLDVRLVRQVQLRALVGQVYLDAFNALNGTNVRGVNESITGTAGARTIKRTWEPLLPRLPSAGVSLSF